MAVLYVIGLLVALLVGGAIGVFVMGLRNERMAEEYRAYQQEVADRHQAMRWLLNQDDDPEMS